MGAMLRRSRVGPAARRLVHGLWAAARRYHPAVRDGNRRGALSHQSARHQGGRGRRHHRSTSGGHQRDLGCAAPLRRARHQDAGDAVQRLENDSGRQRPNRSDSEREAVMQLKRVLLPVLAIAITCGPALAQSSQKPIQIIVPFAPGASADGAARIVANELGPRLGRQVVVEHRAGAGGALGLQMLAKSAPDGDTLGVGATGALLLNPNLPSNPGPDLLRELAPVAKLIDVAIVLVANPSTGPKSIADMIERSKTMPGGLTYGSTGTNTSQHISVELFKRATGANLVHVPYRGSAPAVVDLIGGQIPLASVDLTSAYPHIQAGRLIALGLIDGKRFAAAPEIPTIAESGVPGFGRASGWSRPEEREDHHCLALPRRSHLRADGERYQCADVPGGRNHRPCRRAEVVDPTGRIDPGAASGTRSARASDVAELEERQAGRWRGRVGPRRARHSRVRPYPGPHCPSHQLWRQATARHGRRHQHSGAF